jgi:23S rRNA (cytosine1962-C5)-methyltransferase
LQLPKVRLKKDLRRAVHEGRPWLYRDAFSAAPEAVDGAVVLVVGKDGRPLGRGFFSASGPIGVRMLTTDRNEEVPKLVRERLELAFASRRPLVESGETTAFRWVHGEGDRLPGLHVDVYDRYASVLFDGDAARAFYLALELPELLIETGASLGLLGILERGRRNDESASETRLLAGAAAGGNVEVLEHGLVFEVDLTRAQKGGLFLDQRDNRARVRALAAGRSVLNLFGYTGGFSLHAALGGALATTTVDVSAPAIDAARRNFARNEGRLGERASSNDLVVEDAFEFLERARAEGRHWDLVISDPPSFAPSERARPAALASYRRLHALALRVAPPGGIFCPASCSSHVTVEDFLATVREGARDAGRRFELREMHGAGSDHPVRPEFPEGRYLKFAVGTVR